MENFLKYGFFILLTAMLTGCSSVAKNGNEITDKQNISVPERKLLKERVQVFQGAQSTIVTLPAKEFFVGNSANFKHGTSRVLDLVFGLAGYYQAPAISVTGYARDNDVRGVGKALAAERAQRIAHYLWRFGVPSNFVYADGKDKIFINGSDRAVQSDVVLIDIREAK